MEKAIDFAVRSVAGSAQHGSFAGDSQGNVIQVGSGDSVSLNLSRASVVGYEQQGGDLLVKLSDDRSILLSNYFAENAGDVNHLYLSSDGEITEVIVHEGQGGVLAADYGPVSGWDKWSPLDDMRFTKADSISDVAMVSNEPAGMAPFVPGLLGLGGFGAIAAGAGAIAVITGGGGGGGTPDTTPPAMAVTEGTKSVNHVENGVDYVNGVVIAGTSEPGAKIDVLLNGHTQTTTVDNTGHWTVTFPTTEVDPGEYEIPVVVKATDAAGNSTTWNDVLVVDTLPNPINFDAVTGDDKVNFVENSTGLVVTGTSIAGAALDVTLNGVTKTVVVGTDGHWTTTYPTGTLPAGEYNQVITATSTDTHGNTSTSSHTFAVDTQTSITFTGTPGGDGMVNASEAAAGVVLNGTAQAGASISVAWNGTTLTTVANSSGVWSVTYPVGSVTAGSYSSTATATATDSFGNTATTSHEVNVDTEVVPFDRATLSTGADTILNAVEATTGLTVTGHVEAGSTVMLKFGGGAQHAATVAADGSWSLTIPADEIPAGENSVTLTAVATDHVGNVSTLTEQVSVDTIVRNFSHVEAIAGDDILNAAERAAGLTLTGTSEPFSTLVLHLANGSEVAASVGSDGLWSATFPASSLPLGEGNTTVTVTATDRAGNTASYTDSFHYDALMPADPWITNDSGSGNLISGIATAASPDPLTYHAVAATGAATDIHSIGPGIDQDIDVNGTIVPSHWALFTAPVADGSYLVINDTDAAGNEQSTLYLRSTTDVAVDLNRDGLQGFDFGTIDLTSSKATLSLNEAQINSLTGADHQMAIRGDADDHVNITGAVVGAHQVVNGESYTLYTLGSSGASVLVDDDIHVNTAV
ncbi:Ig-like domain-containing protein [Cypionkella sp.]|uniref:Ig-like domain-containing protein n=1 Tax=Cypionkella sp. TaxID=2811411 RepID=UPI002716B32F|nr:Ig-like domain-containing protein [Cypionkella sp.]MDO8983400.1 Ig-like domain-containing protein [Cypionkella sp.]MDP2050244.1 Ig-like domain-containing protein [Cypionkella sp.]